MDLKELGTVNPKLHWYYTAKAAAVVNAVKRCRPSAHAILDVGSGSGFFAEQLKGATGATSVICFDAHYSDIQLGKRDSICFQRDVSVDDIQRAEVILMIDVLEHVANDSEFLTNFAKAAAGETVFIISVPAFMGLWGTHDEFPGHYRRYRRPDLLKLVKSSGLEVERSRYLFRVILPAVWIYRRIMNRSTSSDLKTPSRAINAILRMCCTADNLMPSFGLAGVSVFVVAKVPKRSG